MSNSETTPLQPPPVQGSNVPASSANVSCRAIVDFYQGNSFLLKAVGAIVLAKLYPPLGAVYLCPQITATWIAVIFIFTMAGLSLKADEFAKAATRWRFNLFVLTFNFFVVSLIVFALKSLMRDFNMVPEGLTSGMMVCACMPVTISMVIVLTKSAKGDEASAVVLVATGSILAVFVSPLLMLLYIGLQSDISLSSVFLKLIFRVVVPIVIGQILQLSFKSVVDFVAQNKNHFKSAQEWTLIFILYTVFCKTFRTPIEARFVDVLWMIIFQCLALLISMFLAWFSLRLFFRNEPRLRVVGLYGCTQKSVTMGIPLIGAVYENDPRVGIFTLPLLVWHPAQLLIGSALAPTLAESVDRLEGYLENRERHDNSSRRQSFFLNRAAIGEAIRRASNASSVAFEPSEDLLLED